MSGPVPDGSKSVVPFGAKSKNVADPLEAAGQTILGLVHRAASTAEKLPTSVWISLRSCRLNSKQLKTA